MAKTTTPSTNKKTAAQAKKNAAAPVTLLANSALRQKARVSLQGNWAETAALTFLYIAITSIILLACLFVPFLGWFVYLALCIPLSYAMSAFFVRIVRQDERSPKSFFRDSFNRFGAVWGLIGRYLLKVLPQILSVIASVILLSLSVGLMQTYHEAVIFLIISILALTGSYIYLVVRALDYCLALFAFYDNPQLSNSEILDLSEAIIRGHKWKFIGLSLSFIGWAILASLTFGIGTLFLSPYMGVSFVHFYDNCRQVKKL